MAVIAYNNIRNKSIKYICFLSLTWLITFISLLKKINFCLKSCLAKTSAKKLKNLMLIYK